MRRVQQARRDRQVRKLTEALDGMEEALNAAGWGKPAEAESGKGESGKGKSGKQ
ncbi:hypothetical protein NE236_09355 [Actinoallomurus purpureus]|uniref:hypothetical protein n=1 Tax=Actinoallomurus purpureus TaxID=478114 RepID=UPI00209253E3|nr:hypothetical protein [Actinoallomurus purpureus]MCO6005190.1 hypothetical protein [Actinoallomurus purpureus]